MELRWPVSSVLLHDGPGLPWGHWTAEGTRPVSGLYTCMWGRSVCTVDPHWTPRLDNNYTTHAWHPGFSSNCVPWSLYHLAGANIISWLKILQCELMDAIFEFILPLQGKEQILCTALMIFDVLTANISFHCRHTGCRYLTLVSLAVQLFFRLLWTTIPSICLCSVIYITFQQKSNSLGRIVPVN